MFHKSLHIFDIHLTIRIETNKPFDFELVTIVLNEIISGLISSTTSSIDSMVENYDNSIRILLFFALKNV
ncbi:MAG: hypothetical protein WCJ45_08815 [bacterium]